MPTLKGLILAAGEGVRMRPLTANIPKPLLPIAGKATIIHTIEAMRNAGITELQILVGWRANRLKETLGDGENFDIKIEYVIQEERLGTAHAISMLKDKLAGERFCCAYGDIIVSPKALEEALRQLFLIKESVMCVAAVDDPSRYGAVEVKDGFVKNIWEKSPIRHGNLINAGIYVLNPDIFEFIEATPVSTRGEYELTDSLTLLMKQQELRAHDLGGGWLDIARSWELLTANEIVIKEMVPKILGDVEQGAILKGPVFVGEGSEVLSGSYIVGPVYIGQDCEIGPNCFIRPSTSLGDRCKVGNAVEVKNSIIMDDSKVPHNSYVGDSVIGERCNFGAGTNIANLRLDDRPIPVIVDGERISSGRRKLGAIIGDDVKTGINASIIPGTIIEESCFIGPGAIAEGYIVRKSRIL